MKTIQQEVAESMAQVVDRIDGRDVTRGELSAAFDRVKPADHWKNPIDATIKATAAERKLIERAIVFFTGSVAMITPAPRTGTERGRKGHYLRIRAAGYFRTCGA